MKRVQVYARRRVAFRTWSTALICCFVTLLADLRMYVAFMKPENGLKVL